MALSALFLLLSFGGTVVFAGERHQHVVPRAVDHFREAYAAARVLATVLYARIKAMGEREAMRLVCRNYLLPAVKYAWVIAVIGQLGNVAIKVMASGNQTAGNQTGL